MATKQTAEEFISKARSVHGERYRYDSVVYENSRAKVEIVCDEHGAFMQTPGNHIKGAGCRKCAARLNPAAQIMQQDDVIAGFRKTHGDRYSYEAVRYVRSRACVTVTCRVHGDFQITPNSHMCGSGCPACGQLKRARTYSGGLPRFIEKAKALHGERFDYSASVYRGSSEKLEILCAEHGSFWMTASAHLVGQKCPSCYDCFRKEAHVYVLSGDGMSKVGIAVDPRARLAKVAKASGIQAELFCSFVIQERSVARRVESAAHRLMSGSNARLSGFDGCTEWFDCNAGDAVTAVVSALHQEGISHKQAIRFP